MQALAMHNKRVPVIPVPSKRTSVNYHGQHRRDKHGGGTCCHGFYISFPKPTLKEGAQSIKSCMKLNLENFDSTFPFMLKQ